MVDLNQQMKLIVQALAAAQASIDLARQLLRELPGGASLPFSLAKPTDSRPIGPAPKPNFNVREVPGVIGVFDGENLVTQSGEKYKVPENYASKTGVVFGDKLKMVDSSGQPGGKAFKQIERVKRQRVEGILSKSESGFKLTTADGAYKVLSAAVAHFGAGPGTEMFGLLPKDNKNVPFAAVEGLVKPPLQTVSPIPEGKALEKPTEEKNEPTQPKKPAARKSVKKGVLKTRPKKSLKKKS